MQLGKSLNTKNKAILAIGLGLGAVILLSSNTRRNQPPTTPGIRLGNPTAPSSRDVALLHPALRLRWMEAKAEYRRIYPNEPQPFITQTFRNKADQEKAMGEGYSKAAWGQSLHNYAPALAFDIAFEKVLYSRLELFSRFAAIAKRLGLEWGGDWSGFVDRPHFQPANYTWRDAQAGRQPWGG